MRLFPVMLRLEGRKCVVVGGGAVALRRAGALAEAGADVTVIAPKLVPAIRELKVQVVEREYKRGDLKGAVLVVAATDDPAVNEAVSADAVKAGVLVNRADDAEAGDVVVPAQGRHGPVTITVYTGGVSATAAVAIRDQLAQALDPDWVRLLEVVGEYRDIIQDQVPDPRVRSERLAELGSARMLGLLKERGVEAVRRRCEELAEIKKKKSSHTNFTLRDKGEAAERS